MSLIQLIEINAENYREALELSVHPDQARFVSSATPPVAMALAKAYIRPENRVVEPYGIYNGDELVGFLNLHYTPESQDDYWIFHFFIDKRFQRSGFGAQALNEVVKKLKQQHPSAHRLRLTVHTENLSAQSFYKKFGFRDDGTLTYGDPTYSYLF
ncbi:diamine N-acetyltransferase [Fictibacillus enclensis]|uniref:GCN5 family acetyltransferase n=1 Tax=Fictibacillus enclensis TaxID=1017270 RepID=A0A0V8JCE1_9BACL|nr:GNAT family N-acetyltransferase [Fictibacillus enclensis]KSU84520.1 GCN5 family acetyltransferase [Fictibacillus enclensis]SCB80867.1 diamine N-acetyltransferase [Fictibacillus enclensis]